MRKRNGEARGGSKISLRRGKGKILFGGEKSQALDWLSPHLRPGRAFRGPHTALWVALQCPHSVRAAGHQPESREEAGPRAVAGSKSGDAGSRRWEEAVVRERRREERKTRGAERQKKGVWDSERRGGEKEREAWTRKEARGWGINREREERREGAERKARTGPEGRRTCQGSPCPCTLPGKGVQTVGPSSPGPSAGG